MDDSDNTAVMHYLNALHDEAFAKGRELGYAEGYNAGVQAARDYLAGMTTPQSKPLSAGIEELNLTPTTYNLLKNDGIHTIGDLTERTRAELLDISGFAEKRIAEVETALKPLYRLADQKSRES